MDEIIVVGNEEFTFGFELIGIKSFKLDKFSEIISSKSSSGIVIISRNDYETLSIKIKNIIDKITKPIVVILSDDDIKGNNLRDQVMKVLGVDLMK